MEVNYFIKPTHGPMKCICHYVREAEVAVRDTANISYISRDDTSSRNA